MQCKECGLGLHPYLPTATQDLQCPFCQSVLENIDKNYSGLLQEVIEKIKNNSNTGGYHCVVPLRGDAEDYYVVDLLIKNNLNPIVTFCNSYFLNDIGWHNIHNLITTFDVDSRIFNPNLSRYREFVSHTIRRIMDPKLPIRMLSYRFAYETAEKNNIPYIIYGTCAPAYYTGKFPANAQLRLSRWWTEQHDMSGSTLDEIINSGAQLSHHDVSNYLFPNRQVTKKIQGLFLSNYMKWRHLENNLLALNHGFLPQSQTGTFDYLENSGCSIHYNLHDLLRIKKFGNGKGNDHSRILVAYYNDNADYCNSYGDIVKNTQLFFKKFLESTQSGFEWYYENKLKSTIERCKHNSRPLNEAQNFPDWLKKSLELAVTPSEQYILFKKGI